MTPSSETNSVTTILPTRILLLVDVCFVLAPGYYNQTIGC
jgi:hypothetical protein